MKEHIGKEKILSLFRDMEQLGYHPDQTISLINKIITFKNGGEA